MRYFLVRQLVSQDHHRNHDHDHRHKRIHRVRLEVMQIIVFCTSQRPMRNYQQLQAWLRCDDSERQETSTTNHTAS